MEKKKKTVAKKQTAPKRKPVQSRKKTAKRRAPLIKTDVTPFILLAASLLIETCLLLETQAGKVGAFVHTLFFGLFGASSHFIPVAMLLLAFFYGDLKERGTLRFKLIIAPVACVVSAVVNSLFAQNGFADAKFSFADFWVTGTLGESGGVFGSFFGILIAKLFGGTVATVISVIAVLALLCFAFGKSRIGVFTVFMRGRQTAPVKKPEPEAPRTADIASVSTDARNISTVLGEVETAKPELPNVSSSAQTEVLGFGDSDEEEFQAGQSAAETVSAGGFEAPRTSDGVNSNGQLTDIGGIGIIAESDVVDGGTHRSSYRSSDLMEEFGFTGETSNTGKSAKPDIYGDEEVSSATAVAAEADGSAYSPFSYFGATKKYYEQRGASTTPAAKPSATSTPSAPSASTGVSGGVSPFADPLSIMNTRLRDTSNAPPIEFIMAGKEDLWKEMVAARERERLEREAAQEAARAGRLNGVASAEAAMPAQTVASAAPSVASTSAQPETKAFGEAFTASVAPVTPIAPVFPTVSNGQIELAFPDAFTHGTEDDGDVNADTDKVSTASDLADDADSAAFIATATAKPAPTVTKAAPQVTPVTPQVTPVTPQATAAPQVTPVTPQATAAPQVTPAAPQATAAPQVTPVMPQATAAPQVTLVTPQATPAPQVTPAAPQATAAPQAAPVTPQTARIAIPQQSSGADFDGVVPVPEQDDGSEAEVYDEERDPRIINPFGKYNKLRYPNYQKPPTELLDLADESKRVSEAEINEVMHKILEKFDSFHVDARVTGYSAGPAITRYEVTPGPGVKVRQITGLSEDIELALQSEKVEGEVRIVNVPGKSVIGIEVPNSVVAKVSLRSLIENPDFQNAKSKITVCVGLTVSGKPVFMNIDDMPHVLVAGQTKSGKSVAINAMIMSMIYRASPDEVQFILIDPKQVELSIYEEIPHMVMPVISDVNKAAGALQWAVAEMERRYTLIKNAKVRDRGEYYKKKDQIPDFEYMPQIVIIIDELADLMLQVREHVEEPINRLAAKARACGINLVIGTQRPSTDIVTGLIKANIPSKIAFRVASNVDSRVILGNVGAEKLLGRGDMLYHPTGSSQIRAQGAFVDTDEIQRVIDYIIEKNGKVEFDMEILSRLQSETDKLSKDKKSSAVSGGDDDYAVDTADIDFDYLCQAIELVINLGKATTNVIQRHLKIGFNRASNIVDKLEDLGFISKSNGSSRPRDVLIDLQTYYEWKANNQK